MDTLAELGLKTLEILSPAIGALVLALFAQLALYIRAHVKTKWARDTLLMANGLARDVVQSTQQSVVSAIKEANEDRKLTEEEIIWIAGVAKIAFVDGLGEKGMARLQQALGLSIIQVDKWAETKLESALHEMKREDTVVRAAADAAAANPTPPPRP